MLRQDNFGISADPTTSHTMSQNFPEDLSLGYGLVTLSQTTGARSAWLQKGKLLIDSNLPFAESRIEEMVRLIDEMATSYAEVGREMEVVFFGFKEHFVLAVFERSLRVVLFFPNEKVELVAAVTAARRFLRKNRQKIDSKVEETLPVFIQAKHAKMAEQNQRQEPSVSDSSAFQTLSSNVKEPEPTPIPDTPHLWPEVAGRVRNIMTSVVHAAQAQNIIDRTLAEHHVPKDGPPVNQIAIFARLIVDQVPNRSKRAALSAEVEDVLAQFRLG